MSRSPEKPLDLANITMISGSVPAHASVSSNLSSSTKIKQEEPDIGPLTPAIVSRLAPILINTPTTTSAHIPASMPHTITPALTPAGTTVSPTVPTPTVPSNNRKQGRQGRPAKERLLTKKQPAETVNYPCHEETQLSDFHRQKLRELSVYPVDRVSGYTRSIPFKGAKESFLKKTGRNRFDVFEYRFTAPNSKGEDKHWWVMWDYYNGLVRVHDLFDCCKPGKTEPGNAVKERVNPGLQDVCHNITGGNLHAQGYWIPFLAAKALAAKFCFRIRYALTIIFGDDFPAQCLPETHAEFGKYGILDEIIKTCLDISAQQHAVETQRATPAPSTPSNFSSSASSVVTPGTESPLAKHSMSVSSRFQRISVTPERTVANRYFDPVRGGYTNGSSSKSQPSMFSADKMRVMAKKVAKSHKAPRGLGGGTADNSSTDSSKSTMQSDAELIRLPPMGNFPLSSSSSFRKPLQASAGGTQRPENEKMGMQAMMIPRISTQIDGSMPDISADRQLSPPPAAGNEGQKKGTGKRTRRRATPSSLGPTSQPHAGGAFVGHNPETHDEPTRKKPKITSSEPHVHTNPYMNQITFCVGTFTNPHRASRDPSLPSPSNPYTKRRYDELVASQVEESQDDLMAVEAAGQLMELQRRDYDRVFAQRMKESNSVPKRRRSN